MCVRAVRIVENVFVTAITGLKNVVVSGVIVVIVKVNVLYLPVIVIKEIVIVLSD